MIVPDASQAQAVKDGRIKLGSAASEYGLVEGKAEEVESIGEELAKRRFDIAKPPPPAQSVFKIGTATICTPGNLTLLTAGIKSGKSAFLGAMLSSVMSAAGDNLGVTSDMNPEGKTVIHLDTEQSIQDHWNLVHRSLRRAKRAEPPLSLHSYCLTGFPARKCCEALKWAMRELSNGSPGIHSVIVDGFADLVVNVNDPEECNAFVAELHGLAIEYDCPIIGAIHFNHGTDKVRGHLGSQLERKAETNLVLEKSGEVVSVYSIKQRREPIPSDTGPRFKWSQAEGMHMSCDAKEDPKLSEKIETLKMQVGDVFLDRPSMRYTDLVSTVMNRLSVVERTAQRRVKDYRQFELIKEEAIGLWISTL